MKALTSVMLALLCLTPRLPAQTRDAYQALVTGQGPLYYFKLDGSTVDSVSNTISLYLTNGTSIAYSNDVWGNAGACYRVSTSSTALVAPDIVPGGGPGADATA